MKKKLALSVALSSVFILSGSLKAEALDYQQLLRSFIDKKMGGNAYTQELTKNNINNRQAQLEQEIEAGAKTGKLTAEEEAELRADLVKIAHHESSYLSDGKFQDPEVVQLLSELNALSSKIKSYLSNSSTTGTGNLSHDEWFKKYGSKPSSSTAVLPNAPLRKAHIDTMQAEIDSRIQDGVTSGFLTWEQSRDFTNQLNKIRTNEIESLRDGKIDWDEEQKLLTDLRNLRRKVNYAGGYRWGRNRGKYRHGRYGKIYRRNRHQPLLHQRIADKVREGKLSRSAAYDLYKKESKIHTLEQKLRTGSNLTFDQERNMYKELEQLTQNIEQKLNSL